MTNKKVFDGNANKNVERVSKLPEEYILAIEEIVDSFDRDWRNRIVYGQYIDYLCDVFEEAIAQGKSVDEVIPSDRKAYAKQLEEELNFKKVEPTKHNTIINYLIIADFIIYVGLTIFSNGTTAFATNDIMFYVLGMLVILGSYFFKYKKAKSIEMKTSFIAVQYIVSLSIVMLMQGSVASVAVAFILNIASDYVLLTKHLKN